MTAILNFVNKKFSPRELLVLPIVFYSGGSTSPKTTKKHLFCYKTGFSPLPLDYMAGSQTHCSGTDIIMISHKLQMFPYVQSNYYLFIFE